MRLYLSLLALLYAGVSSAQPSKGAIEIEEVDTPNWIIDETEQSIIENREADYNQDQFVTFSDDEDEDDFDLPPLDLDDDKPGPVPQPTLGERRGPTPARSPRRIPSMDPRGGIGAEPQEGNRGNGQTGGAPAGPGEDPFPPAGGEGDPFPPAGDDGDPFPPGGGDPFPPGGDPFPPITDPIGGGLPGFGDPFFPDPGFGFGNGPVAIADQVVNLGHKLWKIIEANKPVITANYKYANAIPQGSTATDLEYFSPVQYKSFRIKVKNRFDKVVVDITYTTVHRYGGQYEGQGKFLERVSIVPSKVQAAYNYKVNFDVINVTVANVGSKDEPVASMGVDALIEYGSTFKKTSRRIMFEFRGDSSEVKQYRVD